MPIPAATLRANRFRSYAEITADLDRAKRARIRRARWDARWEALGEACFIGVMAGAVVASLALVAFIGWAAIDPAGAVAVVFGGGA